MWVLFKKKLKTNNRWKLGTPTGVFVLNKDALINLSLWKTATFSILVLSCKALLWTRSRTRPSQRIFPLPFDLEVGCPHYLLNHTQTALQTGPGWGRTLPFSWQLTTFSLPTWPFAAAHVFPHSTTGPKCNPDHIMQQKDKDYGWWYSCGSVLQPSPLSGCSVKQ